MMARLAVMLAALAWAGASAAPVAPLGRLFSTPEERAALDALRAGATLPASAPPAAASEAAPPSPPVTLNGIVRRSSGRSTAWLDGVPQDDASNTFAATPAPALSLRSATGKRLILKPGQSVNLQDGSVREAHER